MQHVLTIGKWRLLLKTLRVQLGDGLGEAPYVLFAGLAFLLLATAADDQHRQRGRMTIE